MAVYGPGQVIGAPVSPAAPPNEAERVNNKPSDQRFRSFAERYLVERCRLWPADADTAQMAWDTIAQAKTIYKMILEQGRNVKE
jgi:hypothetical protein